jgi:hypothetical protein
LRGASSCDGWATRRGGTTDPWALVGAPIKSMITASGDAWSDFVLVEGDGDVSLIIAPEGSIRANNVVEAFGWHTVVCRMINGAVIVNSIEKRSSTPDWVSRMALSESVRVIYVAATRMVRIVRHGQAYDLAPLPEYADIARMRFGVVLNRGNSMRVTGMSAGVNVALGVVCQARSVSARGQ